MIKRIFFALLPAFLVIVSCRKNTETNLTAYLNVADNIVIAETVYDYPVGMILRALKDTALINYHYTFIDSAFVLSDADFTQLTFTFLGKFGPDTVYRTGNFIAYITGDPSIKGSRIVLDFQGYFEDDHYVFGNDTIESSGIAGNWIVLVNTLRDGLIFHYDSSTTRYNATKDIYINAIEWIPGNSSFHYFIKCQGSGTTTQRFSFSYETKDSLAFQSSCPWILGGKINMSSPSLEVNPCVIDFIEEDGCNDRIRYDFFGNIYYLRKNSKSLKH